MRVRKSFLSSFIILLLFSQVVVSQTKQLKIDSLHEQFKKDSTWIYRPRSIYPLVAIDQRNSFLRTNKSTNSPVNIWGAKVGITLYDRHNMGIGGYSIQSSYRNILTKDDRTVNQNLSFQYGTVFYEYSFIETKHWEVGIPIEVGYGYYNLTRTLQSSGQSLPTRHGRVFPMGTAIDAYFKPVLWLGINIMGGYRYVINDNSRVNLSDWFYSVGLVFYFRQIIQDSRFYLKKRNYKEEVKKINSLTN